MADGKSSVFELSEVTIGLARNGKARLIENTPGPPARIDGLTIGAPYMTQNAPHAGEMHPDGDELLFLISGKLTVVIEDREPARRLELLPGQADSLVGTDLALDGDTLAVGSNSDRVLIYERKAGD